MTKIGFRVYTLIVISHSVSRETFTAVFQIVSHETLAAISQNVSRGTFLFLIIFCG